MNRWISSLPSIHGPNLSSRQASLPLRRTATRSSSNVIYRPVSSIFLKYKSFELLSLHVRFIHLPSVFIVIYRPPISPPNETFFVDIADVLERTVSFAGCVVIGDINVHTVRLVTLFDNVSGCATSFAARQGRIPITNDVFFTRSDWPAPVIRVDPLLISDHSFLVVKWPPDRFPICRPGFASGACSYLKRSSKIWNSRDSSSTVNLTSLSCLTVTTPLSSSYWTNMRRGVRSKPESVSLHPGLTPSVILLNWQRGVLRRHIGWDEHCRHWPPGKISSLSKFIKINICSFCSSGKYLNSTLYQ